MSITPRIGVLFGGPPYRGTALCPSARTTLLGLYQAADQLGVDLLLSTGIDYRREADDPITGWPEDPGDLPAYLIPVGAWNCDGLLVVGTPPSQAQREYLRNAEARGTPIVYAATYAGEPRVDVDDAAGISMLVDHLVELGHRRIAFLGGIQREDSDHMVRYQAYVDRIAHHHIEFDDGLVGWSNADPVGAREAVVQLMRRSPRATALITHSGEEAVWVQDALKECGIRVPAELTVMCHDGEPIASRQLPPLTAIDSRTPEVAARAIDMLVDRIRTGTPGKNVVLDPLLIVRKTSVGPDGRAPAPDEQTMTPTMADELSRFGLSEEILRNPSAPREIRARMDELHGAQNLLDAIPRLIGPMSRLVPNGLGIDAMTQLARAITGTCEREIEQRERYADELSILSGELHRSADTNELIAATLRRLHGFNVRTGAISLFDGPREGGVLETHYTAAGSAGHTELRRHVHGFHEPPPIVPTGDRRAPIRISIMPLVTDASQVGLLWLDMRAESVHAAIAELFSINLERLSREQRLTAALREKQVLLQEVHHRVKNNLSVIASLLSLKEAHETDPHVTRTLSDLRNRVHSVAMVHEKLYESPSLDRISVRSLLHDLMQHITRSIRDVGGDVTTQLSADEIIVTPGVAVPLGLIVTEVLINAARHAFPVTDHPELSIEAKRTGSTCVIRIRDNGPGIPDTASRSSTTLGMTLIGALVEQLRGGFSLSSDSGTVFELVVPIEEADSQDKALFDAP